MRDSQSAEEEEEEQDSSCDWLADPLLPRTCFKLAENLIPEVDGV